MAMKHEEMSCNIVESLRKCTYIGDIVSAVGGCEAAVTERTRFCLVAFVASCTCINVPLLFLQRRRQCTSRRPKCVKDV